MAPTRFPVGFDADAHRAVTGIHLDAVLTAIADRQHGAIAARQILALGFGRKPIVSRLRSGHLTRKSPGVYLVGQATPTAAGRRMVGVLGAGDGAVLGELSAAAHRGAQVWEPRDVQVIVPPGRRVRRRGVDARDAIVLPHEHEIVDGIPCLTWPRLLLDLAAHRGPRTLEGVWHDVIYRKLLDERGLRRVLHEHIGEPGTVELRRRWEHRQDALGASANRLESDLRDIVVEAGMPEPRRNHRIRIGEVLLRPDLYIPERGLALETDGRDGHEDAEQQVSDAVRDTLYRSVGLNVGRFGWWAVNYQRPGVLADLARYEAAWHRRGGAWTAAEPPPAFTFGRSSTVAPPPARRGRAA